MQLAENKMGRTVHLGQTGPEYGPFQTCQPGIDPGCSGPVPAIYWTGAVFKDTVTEKQPGFPWWILLAAAGGLIVLKKSQK